ncbi:hypothetical protein GCM10010121_062370 [Streptomyces brasiliensis]|uniref:Uncharacterized protein n=1 Tax=Streptomyces brasiliensis TaxID=1954 RepID=A0A917L3A2_9ACTN|nr:hypothetical protein GCM10010121_062370 [Streptomyces brasiliensis]
MVRRGDRSEIRAARRTVPDHDGLPEGEHDAEHHAQEPDRTDAPHSGGPPVAEAAPEAGLAGTRART